MAKREKVDFEGFQKIATERIKSGLPLLGMDGCAWFPCPVGFSAVKFEWVYCLN
jgi:hypothetical protein